MQLIPLLTPLLVPGNDLASILLKSGLIQSGDIIVLSSKAIATCEGAQIDLSKITPSPEASQWSSECHRSAEFCEAVKMELVRLNGKVRGFCPGAILTEMRPDGFGKGSILTANAGLDESNTEKGKVIGWPRGVVESVGILRKKIERSGEGWGIGNRVRDVGQNRIGVIVSDSCCHPRRKGVTAFALAVSGFDPIKSEIGQKDVHGKPLTITTEATADQLATAANFVMGNANQSIPACIVRDHGVEFSEYEGWVEGIEAEEDMFKSMI